MSKEVWQSQLELNKIFDKRIDMTNAQLTKLYELVLEQSRIIVELAKAAEVKSCGRHCACKDGEM